MPELEEVAEKDWNIEPEDMLQTWLRKSFREQEMYLSATKNVLQFTHY